MGLACPQAQSRFSACFKASGVFSTIKQVHTVLGRDILSERGGELPVTGVVKVSQGAGWDAGHRAAVSSQS